MAMVPVPSAASGSALPAPVDGDDMEVDALVGETDVKASIVCLCGHTTQRERDTLRHAIPL
jgi:hypothetical protein